MNGQISFEATYVKAESLKGFDTMFVTADYDNVEDFIKSVSISDDTGILDLIGDESIIDYLEDKGYYVTHEKDRA